MTALTACNRRSSPAKALILLSVIVALASVPIFSCARDGKGTGRWSLEITASDIVLPIGSAATEKEVIKLADPSAARYYSHASGTGEKHKVPVAAAYSITDADMKMINGVENTNDTATVTINGRYTCRSGGGRDKPRTVYGCTEIIVSFTDSPLFGALTSQDSLQEVKVETAVGLKGKGKISDSRKSGNENSVGLVSRESPSNSQSKTHSPTKTRSFFRVSANSGTGDNFGDTGDTSSLSGNLSEAEFNLLAKTQHVPIATIGNENVPLYAPDGYAGWAFANLVMAGIGIVMALIALIIAILQGRSKRSVWFVFLLAAGVAGAAVFLVTEDVRLNMVLTDGWTPVNAALFAVSIVSVIIYLRKKESPSGYTYKY